MARRRLSVQEAAGVLGTSVDAVRSRVRRGSLDSEKGEDGRVFVWLGDDQSTAQPQGQVEGSGMLVEELRERVRFVEGQLEAERQAHSEARRLLAAALERIPPQLEAPQERSPASSRGGFGEGLGEESTPAQEGAQEGAERPPDTAEWPVRGGLLRPWWRRVFGS